MQMKIPCDWFLTDGVLTDVRLGAPLRVMDALRRTGDIPNDGSVLSRLHSEWVFRRAWRYRGVFRAPEMDGDRKFLVLEGLSGQWSWRINGALLKEGCAGRAEAEVTGKLREGEENEVEIIFAPSDNSDLVSENGFFGSLFLKSCGERAIKRLSADFSEGIASVSGVLSALKACECEFRYALTMNGETRETRIVESIPAGEAAFSHAPFDALCENGKAELALEIYTGGEREDDARLSAHVSQSKTPMRGFSASDAFGMAYIHRAGGNAVCAPDFPRLRNLASDRRLRFSSDAEAFVKARPAFQRPETLEEMAGETGFLYKKGAIFRLSGLETGALDDVYALAGERKDDRAYVSALSRYLQAVSLRAQAEAARKQETHFLLDGARDLTPMPVSPALFDKDERPRPAYFALMDAWKAEHAYAVMPDSVPDDGILAIPVYYLTDNPNGLATINARAYAMDGHEVVSASFPALGQSAEPVGRLLVEIPEDGLLILRTRVMRNDEPVSVSDRLVFKNRESLSSLPQTQLLLYDGSVENAGTAAAIGVSIPGADYFGILLPGETIAVPTGKPNRAEGLNTIF